MKAMRSLLILVALLLAVPATAATTTGVVQAVKDGDTVVIAPTDGGDFFTCRLYGIDAPETAKRGRSGQPFGAEAGLAMKRMTLGKTVHVTTTGAKTWGREVCLLSVGGIDVNLEMVASGYAWAYTQYTKQPYTSRYLMAEEKARAGRLGLWADRNPTPPWEFRRQRR